MARILLHDGKEKAPAAICRKVAMAPDGGSVEIWGDGEQTRSFLFIEECLRGTTRLMRSNWQEPVNGICRLDHSYMHPIRVVRHLPFNA
jgi:nucleoside-diphosphate-sugar epimerase